jgi:formate dehydrogenase iron-sulfur subunit
MQPSAQPPSPFSAASRAEIEMLATRFAGERGGLLPLLHAIQQALGYVPAEAVPIVAEALNLSRAEVHGTISFYHDFRSAPAEGRVVKLCRAEACQARGVDAVAATLEREGVVTEPVYCLGLCAVGPSALVDGQPVAGVQVAADLAPRGVPSPSGAAALQPRVFVSGDMASVALGSDAVAAALADAGADVVRTGSHGLFAIEPLVEVETAQGRIGYGPVAADEVAQVLDGTHPNRLGAIAALPFFARQQRFTFARCGIIDPLSLADYAVHGGWAGLDAARASPPQAVVDAVKASGLRGRGGAGFPTGIKWQTVLDTASDEKFIVCNADEGDSGTFADRMLMEGDPFCLIEGMAIAARAVGATYGYVYIRSEYPFAIRIMRAAIEAAAQRIAPFALEVREGAGAYVCGEETALLESIEGKRGQVRAKPPLPAIKGLFGQPTVINNVLSLAAVPFILAEGPERYAEVGFGRSRGTMPIQLAGNVKNGGLFEIGFGITLGELVHDVGGGTASGRPVRAVQVGGPLGAYIPPSRFDLPFDYESFAAAGGLIGHAGITVFDDSVDMARMARFAMEFCAIESCGKCTPCRIGSTRGVELIDRIIAGTGRQGDALEAMPQMRNARTRPRSIAEEVVLLRDLCDTMKHGSLCALGGFTPYPVLSALDHFPEDFGRFSEDSGAPLNEAAE